MTMQFKLYSSDNKESILYDYHFLSLIRHTELLPMHSDEGSIILIGRLPYDSESRNIADNCLYYLRSKYCYENNT